MDTRPFNSNSFALALSWWSLVGLHSLSKCHVCSRVALYAGVHFERPINKSMVLIEVIGVGGKAQEHCSLNVFDYLFVIIFVRRLDSFSQRGNHCSEVGLTAVCNTQ